MYNAWQWAIISTAPSRQPPALLREKRGHRWHPDLSLSCLDSSSVYPRLFFFLIRVGLLRNQAFCLKISSFPYATETSNGISSGVHGERVTWSMAPLPVSSSDQLFPPTLSCSCWVIWSLWYTFLRSSGSLQFLCKEWYLKAHMIP